MRGWRGWIGAVSLSLMAVGFTSCGTNTPVALADSGATMEGSVTYDSKSIHYAMIIVEGANGGSATGNMKLDGTYKVDNVPLGEVRIAVVTNPGLAKSAQMAAGANQGPDSKGPGKMAKIPDYFDVPNHYHETGTSGITKTIEKGTNKFDIVLDKPKK